MYKDASLTLGGRPRREGGGLTCERYYASFGTAQVKPYLSQNQIDSGLEVYSCVGGHAELSFLSREDREAYPVTNIHDQQGCVRAAKRGAEINGSIPLTKLKPGQQFCMESLYDFGAVDVDLVSVQQVWPGDGKVRFMVTGWGDND